LNDSSSNPPRIEGWRTKKQILGISFACIRRGYRVRRWRARPVFISPSIPRLPQTPANPSAPPENCCSNAPSYIEMATSFAPLLFATFLCTALSLSPGVFDLIRKCSVVNPFDGSRDFALEGLTRRSLVVVLPQLGDFDTAEYVEQLMACEKELREAELDLRIIGIGDVQSAKKFSGFTGLSLDQLRVDPTASIHEVLKLHAGPNWDAPPFIPDAVKPQARAWINYMAMCSGFAAPGTMQEILRGYVGDKTATERLRPTDQLKVGPLTITGTRRVQIGPLIDYENSWKEERG
jgi:hypothetical protein